jgi:hypothetical protein
MQTQQITPSMEVRRSFNATFRTANSSSIRLRDLHAQNRDALFPIRRRRRGRSSGLGSVILLTSISSNLLWGIFGRSG